MTTPQEAITAESILEKRLSEIRIGETKSEFELRNVSITSDLGKEIISQVAHLYAQQYSLQQNKSEVRGREFAEWCSRNEWAILENGSWMQRGFSADPDKTTSELYQLFLSSNPIESPVINPIGYLKNGKYYSFEQMQGETNNTSDIIQPLYANPIAVEGEEPFKMPTDKKLVDIAILFSQQKGMVKKMELSNMLAMSQFILNRLHENKDVMIPSKTETK